MNSQTKQNSIVGDIVKKVLDVLLYSNMWVAFGAYCLCSQTQLLLFGRMAVTPVVLCITSGVFVIYGLHRRVGFGRLKEGEVSGKFLTIYRLRYGIALTTLLGFAGVTASLSQMPLKLTALFFVPGAIALAYILPVKNGKRLRDMGLVKIFALTLTWAWLTVILPAAEQRQVPDRTWIWMFAERCMFLFAIALAFDLRDIHIDRRNEVKTLPQQLGPGKSKILAAVSLAVMVLFAYLNVAEGIYAPRQWVALTISAVCSFIIIKNINEHTTDYYFSGLVDGMLPLQLLLIVLGK